MYWGQLTNKFNGLQIFGQPVQNFIYIEVIHIKGVFKPWKTNLPLEDNIAYTNTKQKTFNSHITNVLLNDFTTLFFSYG